MRCGLQTLHATTELLRSTTELPELADYVPDRVQEVPDSRQQVACRSIGLTGPDEDIHRQALFSAIFVLMYYLAFSSKVLFRFDYRFFCSQVIAARRTHVIIIYQQSVTTAHRYRDLFKNDAVGNLVSKWHFP